MIHDPSPHRVSACPVHFLWDGRGPGRVLVRAGFLGFIVTGMVGTGSALLHHPGLSGWTLGLLAASGATWGLGQLASAFTARRAARG